MTLSILAMVTTVLVVATATATGAQDHDTSISGMISDGESLAAGVSVDLFTADDQGNRLTWIETAVSDAGADDNYRFIVTSGCYAVTAIAPTDRVFTNGSRWKTTAPICLTTGETVTGIDADLRPGGSSVIVGTVVDERGAPADGVIVDLFQAGADGSRSEYLVSAATGETGTPGGFRIEDVSAGCYVLTYIAGNGETWEATGTRWTDAGLCVDQDAEAVFDPVVLLGRNSPSATLDVLVTIDELAVGGVDVDVFDANADGTRGTYVDSFTTNDAGRTSYGLGEGTGCRVLTFIAPLGTVFSDGQSKWLNRPLCVTADQNNYRFDEVLITSTSCENNAEFELVLRDDFDGVGLADHWSAYNSAGNAGYGLRRPSAVTVDEGMLTITAAMQDGSLVSGGMTLDLHQAYGRYQFRVRTDKDPSQAVSGVVLTWPSSGAHPRDGENNIYETLVQTVDRNPFYTFIHKPFGSHSDLTYFQHDADASQFQIMTMEWTPDRITITRDGPGGAQPVERSVLNETAEDLIPDVDHHLAIQLDAWKHSVAGPVMLEVDWVEVSKYCG